MDGFYWQFINCHTPKSWAHADAYNDVCHMLLQDCQDLENDAARMPIRVMAADMDCEWPMWETAPTEWQAAATCPRSAALTDLLEQWNMLGLRPCPRTRRHTGL